jgi:RimJ/RimL family protein N-acetyltransferase
MKKKLETERLYLREFTLDDAEMIFQMHQDVAITKYTGDPVPWDNIELVQQILTDTILPQYKNNIGRWAVYLKSTNEFLGWCGLKDVNGEIDLGYRYIQKYWGKGYAIEAAKAVLNYGIQLKLKNIIGRADGRNTASIKVLEKIGLTFKEIYLEDGVESVKYILI